MTKHITPQWKSLLEEFELDWRLAGLAPKTAKEYVRHVKSFLTLFPAPTAMNAKQWLEQCPTAPSRRYKARALRRFAKWLVARGDHCMNWWNDVPLAVERPRPQTTVGLGANAPGELVAMSTPTLLANFTTTATGDLSQSATLPSSIGVGDHTLVVASGNTYAVMGLRVVPSSLPTTGLTEGSGRTMVIALFTLVFVAVLVRSRRLTLLAR